jgi:predicted nuclease with TOPRIM domain
VNKYHNFDKKGVIVLSVREFEKIKADIDQTKAKLSRMEGQREELLSRLKEEFDLDSLEDAVEYLEKLKKKLEIATDSFNKAYTEYTNKWQSKL